MSAIALRPATVDDLPYIYRRWTDALLDEAPWRYLPRKRFIDQLRTRQREILQRRDVQVVVACNAEMRSHVVGFAVVTSRPGLDRLEAVYTAPPFRGLGIATSMLRAVFPAFMRSSLVCPNQTASARVLRSRWLLVEAQPVSAPRSVEARA